MADIVPTQVVVINGFVEQITLGEAVSLGQILRYDGTTAKYLKATASGTTEESLAVCMAMAAGILDDIVSVVRSGAELDLGAVITPTMDYALSANAGNIAPYSDLVSTNIASFLGVGLTTNRLFFQIINSKTVKP